MYTPADYYVFPKIRSQRLVHNKNTHYHTSRGKGTLPVLNQRYDYLIALNSLGAWIPRRSTNALLQDEKQELVLCTKGHPEMNHSLGSLEILELEVRLYNSELSWGYVQLRNVTR